MQYPRIYHPEVLSINKIVELSDNAVRHLGLVLRQSPGDKLILFNGEGSEYLSEICTVDKKRIQVLILEKNDIDRESCISLHLGQAISRGEKMDWVIQKAVELGVKEITPLMTQYTVAKTYTQKLQHWKKIMISACEQCGRNVVPVLHAPISLAAWFAKPEIECGLIFDPTAEMPLSKVKLSQKVKIHVLIGAEGGFSAEERLLSQQYHFQSVKLGNRILRTETATVSALSALHALVGDFR